MLEWVDVPLDGLGPQLLFSLGVSLILFYGGLGLSLHVLSKVGVGLVLLAVPGVVITALVVGAAATLAFGLPFEQGFLIGAVVAPTDPAILIPLFERLRVRPKVVQTVVAESALNDPTGAVLAVTIAAFILEGDDSVAGAAGEFLADLGLSVVLGAALGLLLTLVVSERRFGIWRESPALVAMLAVAAGYVSIDSAGGSGYLGAFIAGVIVGNSERFRLAARDVGPPRDRVLRRLRHPRRRAARLPRARRQPAPRDDRRRGAAGARRRRRAPLRRAPAHRARVRAAGPSRSLDP